MLKDYKKATKKDIKKINNIFLTGVRGGCCWNDLYAQFEKDNNTKIEIIKNNWLCCKNDIRYKICSSSYTMNYDGVLKVMFQK